MATRRSSPTGLPRVILASLPWQLKGTCAGSLNTFLSQGMMGILLRLPIHCELIWAFFRCGPSLLDHVTQFLLVISSTLMDQFSQILLPAQPPTPPFP